MRYLVRHLIYLSLTKPKIKCSNVFIQVRNICFTDTPELILLDILFMLKVKLSTFLPIHCCAFRFTLKYIFLLLLQLLESNRTPRMKHLTWCRIIVWPNFLGRIRLGSGLSLSKYFEPISGLHTKLFYNIRSMPNNFFLLWRRFVVLTMVIFVGEKIVIFLQLILFANIAS